ncbi:MAG: Crp/Fnr family transcriptional regulator [Pseudomonadota bacterium]
MYENTIDKLAFHFPYIENTCLAWKNNLDLAVPLSIEKNNSLINAGDGDFNFYFIEDGIFQIKYYSSQGKSRGITCFGKNTLICLASSYLQLDNTATSVYCIRKGKVWRFDGKLLSDVLFHQKYPDLANEVIKQLSTNLLIHITYTTSMLLEPPYERTIFYLLAIDRERQNNSYLPRFTQQEMAEMLNMHRVTLVNILQCLKKDGLIALNQHEIHILDRDALIKKVIPS